MYGVPAHLNLSGFVGTDLVQICLGDFQIQFHFQPPGFGKEMLEIGVEGAWEFREAAGTIIDKADRTIDKPVPLSAHEPLRIHRLLSRSVVATEVDAPRSFALCFSGGEVLRIFDDSEQYESFSIQPGDIFV